jgi:DNA (cytosine-5)-methyltransferase 1
VTLTVGSLFSGVGGFDLGFERAGMQVRLQCEIDKAAQGVLRRHWPDATLYEDVRNVGRGAASVNVVCGGFPCQDVSVAGRRAGLAGERSGLWWEFHRILVELAPEWVVIENVPGLLSSNSGMDFAAILRGLVECGYGVVWRVLDSQHFGVPQRRRRVFIVGHLGDGRAAEVLFEREGSAGDIEPGRSTRQTAAASPEGIAGTVSSKWAKGTGGPSGDECQNLIAVDFRHTSLGSVAPTLQAKPSGSYSLNTTPGVLSFTWHSGTGFGTADDVSVTLGANHYTTPGILPLYYSHDFNQDRIYSADGITPSHTARDSNRSRNILHAGSVRRLTPTECERLQGFPDGWTAGQSDSARYKQMGNAVTVNVAEWIGRRIVAVSS